jgi:hypothetical protein
MRKSMRKMNMIRIKRTSDEENAANEEEADENDMLHDDA